MGKASGLVDLPRRQKKGNSSMLFRSASRGAKVASGSREQRGKGRLVGLGKLHVCREKEETQDAASGAKQEKTRSKSRELGRSGPCARKAFSVAMQGKRNSRPGPVSPGS